MSYIKNTQERLRLGLLKILAEAPGYEAGASILCNVLPEVIGFRVSFDTVQTEAAWLHEQGLVALQMKSTVGLMQITARGMDVARGIARVPGVARPDPVL
jgi:hypothetical protein